MQTDLLISFLNNFLAKNQDALLNAFFSALLTAVFAMIGWFFVRKITNADKHEKISFINNQLDAINNSRSIGLSKDTIAKIEKEIGFRLKYTRLENASGEETILSEEDRNFPEKYWTNWAMKLRATAEAQVVEAKLWQILTEFETFVGNYQEFSKAQRDWEKYRKSQVKLAYSEFEGGTHAGLAATLESIRVTEVRIRELREKFREIASR